MKTERVTRTIKGRKSRLTELEILSNEKKDRYITKNFNKFHVQPQLGYLSQEEFGIESINCKHMKLAT